MQRLEREAIRAHQASGTWADFWATHAKAIQRAEPWNRRRFHRLLNRLMALVVAGNHDAQHPAGTPPWEVDHEQPEPDCPERYRDANEVPGRGYRPRACGRALVRGLGNRAAGTTQSGNLHTGAAHGPKT